MSLNLFSKLFILIPDHFLPHFESSDNRNMSEMLAFRNSALRGGAFFSLRHKIGSNMGGRDYFAGLKVTKRNKATVLLTLTLLQTPTLTLTLILILTLT
jgi:hypothetical protein